MKKYNDNLEVELIYKDCLGCTNLRYYYWRVKPYQLSWWNRLFHNKWNRFERAVLDNWNPCFCPKDYWDLLDSIKTIKDINNYYILENTKIQRTRYKYIQSKTVFPYENS